MQRPNSRPRSKSTFSFKSDKSTPSKHNRSSSRDHPGDVSDEKRKTQLTPSTKANPNAAMNEAQPIAAALEAPTLQSLRAIHHTDATGNPITEPDLSNPTRPRWERPLDTVRGFEAAIDNEYRRRTVASRAEASPDTMSGYGGSRPGSFYGGYDQRASYMGGYGGRSHPAMRDSWAETSHYPGGPPRPRFSQRFQSDSAWNRYPTGDGVYPSHGHQQSGDTVLTGASAGSHSEPYANSTNPSSENSSIDRAAPNARPDAADPYGYAGYGGTPQFQDSIPEERGYPHGARYGPGYARTRTEPGAVPGARFVQYPEDAQVPPSVPAKTGGPNVIKLGSNAGSHAPPATANPPHAAVQNRTEKRKSWFKRRFSKE